MEGIKINLTQEEVIQKFILLKKTKPKVFKALDIIITELEKDKK